MEESAKAPQRRQRRRKFKLAGGQQEPFDSLQHPVPPQTTDVFERDLNDTEEAALQRELLSMIVRAQGPFLFVRLGSSKTVENGSSRLSESPTQRWTHPVMRLDVLSQVVRLTLFDIS
jgi:hypothetical protein